MRVAVTGATGFVGRSLMVKLGQNGLTPVALLRAPPAPDGAKQNKPAPEGAKQNKPAPEGAKQNKPPPPGWAWRTIGDIGTASPDDWRRVLEDCGVVVHLAARFAGTGQSGTDALTLYRRTNRDASLQVARAAAACGVAQLIFVSTIAVYGVTSPAGKPFRREDSPRPVSPYARSKREAEQGLQAIAADTGLNVAIIRSPLVYGPGAAGNFGRLARMVRLGLPLPLAAANNRRSLIGIDNLTSLLTKIAAGPRRENGLFLVSDGEDVSTADLLRRMAAAIGTRARLFPVPPRLLHNLARLASARSITDRLLGSLQMDTESSHAALDWTPPVSLDDGLHQAMTRSGSGSGVRVRCPD